VDVFVDEPLPPDSPWWTARNTIITPHTGGVNPDYWERFGALVMRQLTAIAEGQPCVNLVDRNLGY
jgi:phosphoglycerate dehydrogenase-like enzyme